MTVNIEPVKCFIKESFLFKNDFEKKVKAKIIGVSAYKNEPPSFTILIEEKYLYVDIPFNGVTAKEELSDVYNSNTTNIISPQYEIENFTLEYLKGKCVSFLDVNTKEFKHGIYLTSFDYNTDNEMFHLIKGEDGRFWGLPNHKINWGGEDFLPDYKKK